ARSPTSSPAYSSVRVCNTALFTESKGRGTRHAQDPIGVLGMIAEPTGTDGIRSLSHQRSPSSWLHMASCISGFKHLCQRAKALASQLLPLRRPWHLQSKYQMLSLELLIFRTDILSGASAKSSSPVQYPSELVYRSPN